MITVIATATIATATAAAQVEPSVVIPMWIIWLITSVLAAAGGLVAFFLNRILGEFDRMKSSLEEMRMYSEQEFVKRSDCADRASRFGLRLEKTETGINDIKIHCAETHGGKGK